MSTAPSPNSSTRRRDVRFAEVADAVDAWHHEGDPRPVGYGSLDVPLSVWAEPGPGCLVAGLVRELTEPDAAVAVCGVHDGWQAALTGRSVSVFGDHTITTEAKRMAGDRLAAIRFITVHNLCNHLTTNDGGYGLIVAGLSTSRGEGFFTAAYHCLAPGGYLVIVTGSGNPKTHATIARRATEAGFVYTHHIIATTPAALSRAVDSETVSAAPGVKVRHVRTHRDAFVYQRSEAAQ